MTNFILLHSSDVEIKNHYSFTSCAKWWFQTLCCASRVRGVVHHLFVKKTLKVWITCQGCTEKKPI